MPSGIVPITVELDGSGDGSAITTTHGVLMSLRVERSGGTPTVTISDGVDTIINAQDFASDASYSPVTAGVDNELSDAGQYGLYYLAGHTTVTVTGGASGGTVTVRFKLL